MDIATVIGLLAGFGLIVSAIIMGGGIEGFASFIDPPSLMITVGGSIAALFISYPMGTVFSTLNVVKKCFLFKVPQTTTIIRQFKELATIVRKDGMLALEQELEKLNDDFLKRGLEQVISGADEAQLRNVLETELNAIESRHAVGKQIVDSMGAAAPAFGMIGT
ncbi:MAG TPA: MotA/TolQ/ExbB proton channel family protein, partial [Pirellulaceae bacterium]|nr:MotA/TolQ/ExbB proton channel family protein [Pirellulaceae bacterium]